VDFRGRKGERKRLSGDHSDDDDDDDDEVMEIETLYQSIKHCRIITGQEHRHSVRGCEGRETHRMNDEVELGEEEAHSC
jgi:hypothetical protein